MRPLLSCLAITLLFSSVAHAQDAGPQAGQKVDFMGDSITANGWSHPAGYVRLIVAAMELAGKKIEPIPAGISGHTSKDMLARLDRDVLKKKPDWMTISCGVNDVWHGATGCTLEEYSKNINAILDQAAAAGIKVVILTSTMITEDQAGSNNQKLIPYNDFLREQAKARKLPLADLNADMQAAVTQMKSENPGAKEPQLTDDGVHMNGFGDQMMATGVLKAFGMPANSIAKAKAVWMDMPGAMRFQPKTLSLHQCIQARAVAAQQGKTVEVLLNEILDKGLQGMMSQPTSSTPLAPSPTKR